jgi:cytochrome P450
MHRDARWYNQSDAFIPTRWSEEFKAQLPKYAYFPFGGGLPLVYRSTIRAY